ncbi:unnamed protein product [Candida verbasci]|uniref:Uncharacterized protein n=1 Tax=Candida verbasci TaxID=1227364 RepID=A0A9W4XLP0_9ASCO|nr:unnamed protein product [Candida verbasci]
MSLPYPSNSYPKPLNDKENYYKSVTLPVTSPVNQNKTYPNYEFQLNTAPLQRQRNTQDNYPNYTLQQPQLSYQIPINQIPTTTSYFDVDLISTSSSLNDSPIREYHSSFTSPHNPPYEPDLYYPPPPKARIRSSIFGENNYSTSIDEFMSNRYNRFRPSNSQHNPDLALDNRHPYQQENYGIESKKSNWYESFKTYFKKQPKDQPQIDDIEQQEVPKSSYTDIIIREPESTPQPIYTPRGIPINEYPLNYTKTSPTVNQNLTIVNEELSDELRDLIDGIDNFLISCFQIIWDYIKSVTNWCADY